MQFKKNTSISSIFLEFFFSDAHDMTSLQLAAKHGQLEIVKFLIENGADVQITNYEDLLANEERIEELQSSDNATSPLHFAAQEGHHEVCEYLLNYFHVDSWDRNRMTPLHWASQNGHLKVVRNLGKSSFFYH